MAGKEEIKLDDDLDEMIAPAKGPVAEVPKELPEVALPIAPALPEPGTAEPPAVAESPFRMPADFRPELEPKPRARPSSVTRPEAGEAPPTEAPRPPPTSAPKRLRAEGPGVIRQALSSNAGQVVVLGVVGVVVLAVWTALDARPSRRAAAVSAEPSGAFPHLDVEGRADGVTEVDVQRLLELRARQEARSERSAEVAPRPVSQVGEGAAAVQAQPGEMYDPDRRRMVVGPGGPSVAVEVGPQRDDRVSSGWSGGGGHGAGQGDKKAAHFYAPGGTLEGVGVAPKATPTLPLEVGDRLAAKLVVGVSSSSSQPVLATVTHDVMKAGVPVLRKGDVLIGRARSDDERIYVDFRRVRTDGKEYAIEGYAVAGDMPGLPARRREATAEERSAARAAGGALGGAGNAAGEVLGAAGVLGRVAGGAAQGALDEAARNNAPDRGFILEVSAGKAFDIVIVGSAK